MIMKKPVTLVTAKSVKLLLCARTRTRERRNYRTFYNSFFYCCKGCAFRRLYNKRFVVLSKTTCRLSRTTRRF